LLVVSHVNVIGGQTEPVVVKVVSVVGVSLSIFWGVTVASPTHIPVVVPSPVFAEFVSI
jgi:hypothetical protein